VPVYGSCAENSIMMHLVVEITLCCSIIVKTHICFDKFGIVVSEEGLVQTEQNLFSSSSEMLKTKSSSLNFLSGIQYNAPALFASGKYLFTAATAKNQRRRKKNQRQVQIRLKVRRKQYEESCWPGKRRSRRSGETSSVDVVAKKLVLVHKNPNPRSSTLRENEECGARREREERVLMLWFSVKSKSSGGVFNSCWLINAHNSVIVKTPCIM